MAGERDLEMEDLKIRMAGFEDSQRRTEENVSVLAEAVTKFVTASAVNTEKEKQQQKFNSDILERQNKTDEKVDQLIIDRAQEKQSREFLYKYWPWLSLFATLFIGLVAAVASGLGKSLIT